MKNKYLALIIVVVMIIFVIVSIALNLSIDVDSEYSDNLNIKNTNNLNLKNETFGGINISVPTDLTFKNTDPHDIYYGESFESNNNMIFLETYNKNFNAKDIFNGFKNYSKVNLKGLHENANAYTDPQYEDLLYIIVTNENKTQGIVLTVVNNQELAIKMANSVMFSN